MQKERNNDLNQFRGCQCILNLRMRRKRESGRDLSLRGRHCGPGPICGAMGLILEAAAEEATARSDASTSDSETEGLRQRRPGDAEVLAQEPLWVPPRRVNSRELVAKHVKKIRMEAAKNVEKIQHHTEEHDRFYTKLTYSLGVLCFGLFCFLVGAKPQVIPYFYCFFLFVALPLRWMYYKAKKWHYFLLDFCYYANAIFVFLLLVQPDNERLFMICFAFSEGPLAWAIIVWRCSLVFSSLDKIVSVLIHLLPGVVLFIIRWWDPSNFSHHSPDEFGPWGHGHTPWPVVEDTRKVWTWLFTVPLIVYSVWQALYWIIVEVLRKQRLLRDPQVLTSFRELSRKAERANNLFWWASGLLGDANRVVMYAILQGLFTIATIALTLPMFVNYRFHVAFQIFKIVTSVWNGGGYFFDVMPRQIVTKDEKRKALKSKQGDAAKDTISQPNSPGEVCQKCGSLHSSASKDSLNGSLSGSGELETNGDGLKGQMDAEMKLRLGNGKSEEEAKGEKVLGKNGVENGNGLHQRSIARANSCGTESGDKVSVEMNGKGSSLGLAR
ncbi:hypothetical protein KFL_002990090 [Klebsormidium nitens]|uniref:Glycerophosphocholine acyltransferase 1 n=1 Tax=Klebsormidium nitens TaxID=105231 RepID=A0A1Y1IBX6_KLENI|nr:hypothetical protein KFL_002990090 [Klebsormidium nitens]|eukprot:GAQ86601.1 hypothetical protein KFL_002990090 [Klebsormidium nitens]